MGLKALENAVLSFEDVRVPKENLIGAEGQGLKIALVTLNTGRLALPAGTTGRRRRLCLEICRAWAGERVQWGQPIGKHEAIAHKIADMAANALRDGVGVRPGVAAWPTAAATTSASRRRRPRSGTRSRGWKIVDETMQVRGGRGYETEQSLAEPRRDAVSRSSA